MVKKIVVNKILTDEESSGLEGKWIDESYIKHPLIQSDTDVYRIDEDDNEILLLKFRKRVISDKLIQIGWESYKDLAKASRGRGASAGPINPESQYWKKRDLVKTSKWSTGYLTPKGNEMKKEYDELSLELLQEKAKEMKIDEETINDKNKLILEIIKNNGGVSKMKVNNQVASNPIGYYEESKNFAKLPCRLTHFTRTNYDNTIMV